MNDTEFLFDRSELVIDKRKENIREHLAEGKGKLRLMNNNVIQ